MEEEEGEDLGLHDPDSGDDSGSDSSDVSVVDASSSDKFEKIQKILFYIAKVYPDKWEENKGILDRILINYLRSKPKKK